MRTDNPICWKKSDMHLMECDKCEHGEYLKPGTYTMKNGTRLTTNGTWNCKMDSIGCMSVINGEMYCSEYDDKAQ